MIKPSCSNFRGIIAKFSSVRIVRSFTVVSFAKEEFYLLSLILLAKAPVTMPGIRFDAQVSIKFWTLMSTMENH